MVDMRKIPGGSPQNVRALAVVGALVVLALWFSGSSCYTVDANEQAVVMRFGKYVRTEDPGLHFKLPFGVETASHVAVGRVEKEEFGFRTVRPGSRSEYSVADFTRESLMLTGDLNQAEIEWSVQYKVKDARAFLLNVRDPQATLRALAQSSMRAVIGDRSISEILTEKKAAIDAECQRLLQEAMDRYESGIDVQRIILQSVLPPDPVKAAFNAVNDAEQERETIKNEALKAYNQIIPAARGKADQVLANAEGYRVDRVNRAKGETERFSKVLAEYKKAPEVTRKRLFLETMAEVLPQVKQRIVVDETMQGLLPLLDLKAKSGGGE